MPFVTDETHHYGPPSTGRQREIALKRRIHSVIATASVAIFVALLMASQASVLGQRGRGAAPPSNLPDAPTAVTLPHISEKVAAPGAMFDSAPAQWPGRGVTHYNYQTDQYLVSGLANGQPYTTRLVIRRPADNARFSGLAVAEAMHPIGAAHAFEYNSVYIMDSGHIAVEIATRGADQFAEFNPERYGSINVAADQASDILAQVGALVRSDQGPLADVTLRKMVLWGTSASSGILTRYLPAHLVYRTPEMQHIYDGFMPTSNGSTIMEVDVPMIQVPTQHEFSRVATARQDSDEHGNQYRSYEHAGLGHLGSRHNVRVQPTDCVNPLSTFPLEAYMSVGLHHLLQWVDEGVAPPKADRALLDRDTRKDGSLMVLDDHGNAVGGIRNPYVDVPIATYTERNTNNAAAEGQGRRILCGLTAYQTPFSQEKLRELYGSTDNYVRQFEARLNELEAAGWSLPVYHDLILADARAVTF